MAELFLARKLGVRGFQKLVVIKSIRREMLHDENIRQMFLNEAHLASKIDHPHVVHITDLGQTGDSFFIAMEYIRGQTLTAAIARAAKTRTLVDVNVWIRILDMALDGLDYCHELRGDDGRLLGVVHRDFTPSNIMITYAGTVKVIDFGVARIEQPDNLTQTGTVKGKIGYLSPEQCEGTALDRRSDIFAAGIVLWEMIANKRLFANMAQLEVMRRITRGQIDMPTPADGHKLNDRLAQVLGKALKVDPNERYQSAAEMRDDIRDYLHDMSNVGTYEVSTVMENLFAVEKEADAKLTSRAERTIMTGETSLPGFGSLGSIEPPAGDRPKTVSATMQGSWPGRQALVVMVPGLLLAVAIGVWIARAPGVPEPPQPPRDPVTPAVAVKAPDPVPASVPAPVSPEPASAPTATPASTPAATSPSPARPTPVRPGPRQPIKRPDPPPHPAPKATAPVDEFAGGSGLLDIDTQPYTEVYLGKRRLGETPLLGVKMPAGEVTLTLKNEELNITETYKVTIPKDGRVTKKLKL
jgi:serine/threonine-protein kinase